MKELQIGHRMIGADHPSFIIGELSCNHVGKYDIAVETIKAMAAADADAVKIQTDMLPQGFGSTIKCENEYFTINEGTIWDGANLFDLYMETYTPIEWHEDLKALTEDLGMVFFSTPYSLESSDYLNELGIPVFKIASMELMDLPLVERIASYGKPVIMSRGVSNEAEIEAAVNVCHKVGNDKLIILHCVSDYPTKLEDANVRSVPEIMKRFDVISGVSDHSEGSTVPVLSTALGGRVIEKHVILDKDLGGPDAEFSMTIDEFGQMVRDVRDCEKAIGIGGLEAPKKIEKGSILRRSLFIVKDMDQGDEFTSENIRSIRPGHGLDPNMYYEIIGKKANIDIMRGTPLNKNIIEDFK